ncbi:MAG: HEAT repeat domain-containing protein [Verrucomicrobiae bacterium]|nr:HEAT repeat domain-containing protein [Verrucomicrobiae bacterium]
MSIAVLTQVADEARRLAIAGSQLAKGDFRLQKLVPPLKAAGTKAPVFATVAECAEAVISASEKESAAALLELSTLVGAVLYTQGTTGADGRIADLKNKDLGIHSTRATARVLAPLVEALTTSGSGRLETIRDAHQRGAFQDLRLVQPALKALDDVYPEIGELVADEILPIYGGGIYTAVRDDFDLKGKVGHARRLRLLHKIDPASTRNIVLKAFESGSKEVKVAAIACLGNSDDDLPILKEQASAKNKEVRAAAYEALATTGSAEGAELIKTALVGNDIDQAICAVRRNPSASLRTFLIDESCARFDALIAGEVGKKDADAELNRLHKFVQCISGSTDPKAVKLLRKIVEQKDEFETSLKQAGISRLKTEGLFAGVIYALLHSGDTASRKLLADLALAPDCTDFEGLNACIAAIFLTCKPPEAFEKLSGWLVPPATDRTGRANKTESNRRAKSSTLEEFFQALCTNRRYFGYRLNASIEEFGKITLDRGWLELAISLKNDELIVAIALHFGKTEQATIALLDVLDRASTEHEQECVLNAMFTLNMAEATDKLIEAINQRARNAKGKRSYGYYDLLRLVEAVPQAEKKRIEELIPTLPDDIADAVSSYLV